MSNHVGWADILVHMTRWLPSFVAREETRTLPFIGITRCRRLLGRGCCLSSHCLSNIRQRSHWLRALSAEISVGWR